MTLRITSEARDALDDYMSRYPEAYHHEVKCTQLDILAYPEEFFRRELQEPEHANLQEWIYRSNGLITLAIMNAWLDQNYEEIYVRGKDYCNPY